MVRRQKGNKDTRYASLHNTDVAAKNIWLLLLRDFRTTEGPTFCVAAERAMFSGISEYRDYKYPELGIIPPARFKRYKQLEGLMKKYRFSDDKYTDEELEANTLKKFFEEQEVFASYRTTGALEHLVLQRARKIARGILGKYDPEYTVSSGRFGKKSSIGCPLSLAYIDHKLTDVRAFTGSADCAKWFFNEVLPKDDILSNLVGKILEKGSPDLAHESLNLVNVPKSWKTYRPITPLTLLSLFYSYGVGSQIEDRLRDHGLDIRHLQQRHRVLIKKFSERNMENNYIPPATADLSSASQSLLSALLNRVLPREWYCAMKKTFSHQLCVGTKKVLHYTESVLPMGNGLTFPTETLVFYVILKAIAELSGTKGLISVYGDDLIYPSKLHKFVAVIFPLLKFKLNLDKTFVKAPFRESCGSDFYMGCDVRPAFLPEGHTALPRTKYASWLYKTYNALVRRWDPLEIPETLKYLLMEMSFNGLPIFRVPPSYPDTAGVKVCSPGVIPLDAQSLDWAPIITKFVNGSRAYNFSYLSATPDRRVVVSVTPYYWLALQGLTDDPEPDKFWEVVKPKEAPRQSLEWESQKFLRRIRMPDGRMRNTFVKKQARVTSPARKGEVIKVTHCRPEKFGLNQTEPMSDWI